MPEETVGNGSPHCILIAGAGGGLGVALSAVLSKRLPTANLLTISRGDLDRISDMHHHLIADLEDPGCIAPVREWLCKWPLPNWIVCCCGILHWPGHQPEKNLQQCDGEAIHHSVTVNALTHLHLAQAIDPLLKRQSPLVWTSLSAKVGSIEDNQLGGWYSYRMSKAALNMLVRNLSIEWGRKIDTCCVVALHPGTTDTSLSKPFQRNIPDGKLYSATQSAERIVSVLQQLKDSDSGKLLFWDGSHIPW